MSKATKRKHVVKEVLGDYITPNEKQQIMKIMGSNGNNLHEAVTESGERFLLSMPTKFRKNIWIKRGDFVIIDPIEEGDKVKGEINFILYRDHIHYLRKLGTWPKGFDTGGVGEQNEVQKDGTKSKAHDVEGDSSDSEDERDLFVNTNRTTVQYSESDEDSDDDDEEDQDEERA